MDNLTLAFIGDAIHTAYVRKYFCEKGLKIGKLHKLCSSFCRASNQSEALERIMPLLSEEEKDIVRRARNAKTHEAPKSSSLAEYKRATAFEALIGSLFLTKNYPRLLTILEHSIET